MDDKVSSPSNRSIGAISASTAAGNVSRAATTVPSHKVGKDHMYERYAPAYEEHMSYHNCERELKPLLRWIISSTVRRPRTEGTTAATMTVGHLHNENNDAPGAAATSSVATATPTRDYVPLRFQPVGSRTGAVQHEEKQAVTAGHNIPPASLGLRLIDLGCGTGRMLKLLRWCDDTSPSEGWFLRHVIALDRAQGMLEVCEAQATSTLGWRSVTNMPSGTSKPVPSSLVAAAPSSSLTISTTFETMRAAFEDVVAAVRPVTETVTPSSSLTDGAAALTTATSEQKPPPMTKPSETEKPVDIPRLREVLQLPSMESPAPNVAGISDVFVADLVTCAWSLSSVMNAAWGTDRWHPAMDRTVDSMVRLLTTSSSLSDMRDSSPASGCPLRVQPVRPGLIIVIETLGTNRTVPTRQSSLHRYLEDRHGFQFAGWCRTDYEFPTPIIGERCVRFFFGAALGDQYRDQCRARQQGHDAQMGTLSTEGPVDAATLPECTGVWYRVVPR